MLDQPSLTFAAARRRRLFTAALALGSFALAAGLFEWLRGTGSWSSVALAFGGVLNLTVAWLEAAGRPQAGWRVLRTALVVLGIAASLAGFVGTVARAVH